MNENFWNGFEKMAGLSREEEARKKAHETLSSLLINPVAAGYGSGVQIGQESPNTLAALAAALGSSAGNAAGVVRGHYDVLKKRHALKQERRSV